MIFALRNQANWGKAIVLDVERLELRAKIIEKLEI